MSIPNFQLYQSLVCSMRHLYHSIDPQKRAEASSAFEEELNKLWEQNEIPYFSSLLQIGQPTEFPKKYWFNTDRKEPVRLHEANGAIPIQEVASHPYLRLYLKKDYISELYGKRNLPKVLDSLKRQVESRILNTASAKGSMKDGIVPEGNGFNAIDFEKLDGGMSVGQIKVLVADNVAECNSNPEIGQYFDSNRPQSVGLLAYFEVAVWAKE